MYPNSAKIFAYIFIASITFLSGCESGSKDEVMGNIIMDCQFSAHNAIDAAPFNDEKKHFVIGENVERCLKEKGLQPIQDDRNCSPLFLSLDLNGLLTGESRFDSRFGWTAPRLIRLTGRRLSA
jgi:hypothetical protein